MLRILIITVVVACLLGCKEEHVSSMEIPVKAKIDSINTYALSLWNRDPRTGASLARDAINQSQEVNYLKGEADAMRVLGVSMWARSDYDSALIALSKAKSIYLLTADSLGIANSTMNMGLVLDEEKRYDRALTHHKEALALFKRLDIPTRIATTSNNIGAIHNRLFQLDESLVYYEYALEIRIASQDTFGIAESYNNIGIIKADLQEYAEAEAYYKKSIAIKQMIGNKLGIAATKKNQASLYSRQKQYQTALALLEEAREISEENGFRKWLIDVHRDMYYIHKRLGNTELALKHYLTFTKIKDEVFNEESKMKVAQLELENQEHENELQQQRIGLLERDKVIKAFWNAALAIAVLLAIMAGFFINYRQKHKSRLKTVKLQSEIDAKNKELASYALNFIQKNELMHELTDRINEIKKISSRDTIHELNGINKIINGSFRIDRDWENFKVMFEEVHKNFFINLRKAYPNLGNAEIKICALSRLNLNLKESASILGISADSVKTARYRLKKKLNLGKDENLNNFLLRFDEPSMSIAS